MSIKEPNPIDKHVGNRLRMRRLMLSLSQEKLANNLGITFQQVQKYEKGTNRISASRLQHASHILDVPVSFFFEQAPDLAGHRSRQTDSRSTAHVDGFLATSDGLALAKAFMQIDDLPLRRSIVRVVEGIAEGGRP
jgi:transcriptional regulator with XRE-family HTH domain